MTRDFKCTRWSESRSVRHIVQHLLSWRASVINFNYRKNSKNWDTYNNYHNCPTIGTVGFYSSVLCSNDADRITNSVDPDQTAL